jgi:hypothetical protein
MTKYNLYKHINNTDVAFSPIKVFYVKEKSLYKIKCSWFSIRNKIRYLGKDKIEIPQLKRPEWKWYGELPIEHWCNC